MTAKTPDALAHRVVSWITGETRKAARLEAAKKILQAVDGVEWRKQQFILNGVTLDVDGETTFYKTGEIDAAIKRLNEVLRELSK